MKPQDLASKCALAIANRLPGEAAEDAFLSLVIPKRWKAPKGFPRGRYVGDGNDGSRIMFFNAVRVLDWLARNGVNANNEVRR